MFREQLQAPLEQFGKPFPEDVARAGRELVTQDIPQFAADVPRCRVRRSPATWRDGGHVGPRDRAREDAAFRDQMINC